MACRMSLKGHILEAHFDKLKKMGVCSWRSKMSDFHQDIMDFEYRYQGSYNENLMGGYSWSLIRESNSQYKCKLQKTTSF